MSRWWGALGRFAALTWSQLWGWTAEGNKGEEQETGEETFIP